jgi:hypothetical protein
MRRLKIEVFDRIFFLPHFVDQIDSRVLGKASFVASDGVARVGHASDNHLIVPGLKENLTFQRKGDEIFVSARGPNASLFENVTSKELPTTPLRGTVALRPGWHVSVGELVVAAELVEEVSGAAQRRLQRTLGDADGLTLLLEVSSLSLFPPLYVLWQNGSSRVAMASWALAAAVAMFIVWIRNTSTLRVEPDGSLRKKPPIIRGTTLDPSEKPIAITYTHEFIGDDRIDYGTTLTGIWIYLITRTRLVPLVKIKKPARASVFIAELENQYGIPALHSPSSLRRLVTRAADLYRLFFFLFTAFLLTFPLTWFIHTSKAEILLCSMGVIVFYALGTSLETLRYRLLHADQMAGLALSNAASRGQ